MALLGHLVSLGTCRRLACNSLSGHYASGLFWYAIPWNYTLYVLIKPSNGYSLDAPVKSARALDVQCTPIGFWNFLLRSLPW